MASLEHAHLVDRARGSLLGAAIGDAMGAPCEGLSAATIRGTVVSVDPSARTAVVLLAGSLSPTAVVFTSGSLPPFVQPGAGISAQGTFAGGDPPVFRATAITPATPPGARQKDPTGVRSRLFRGRPPD